MRLLTWDFPTFDRLTALPRRGLSSGRVVREETKDRKGRKLSQREACKVGEPVEEVAGTGGDEGLGDFLQRDDREQDEGGQGDEERAASEPAAGEGEVAEERERSEEDDVPGFVGVSDFMDEGQKCSPFPVFAMTTAAMRKRTKPMVMVRI